MENAEEKAVLRAFLTRINDLGRQKWHYIVYGTERNWEKSCVEDGGGRGTGLGRTKWSRASMLCWGIWALGPALLNDEQGRFWKVYWVTRVPESQHSPLRVNTVPHEDLLSGVDVLFTTDCGLYQLMTVVHNSSWPERPMARRQHWIRISLGVSVGGHVCCKAKMASKYRILSNPR